MLDRTYTGQQTGLSRGMKRFTSALLKESKQEGIIEHAYAAGSGIKLSSICKEDKHYDSSFDIKNHREIHENLFKNQKIQEPRLRKNSKISSSCVGINSYDKPIDHAWWKFEMFDGVKDFRSENIKNIAH